MGKLGKGTVAGYPRLVCAPHRSWNRDATTVLHQGDPQSPSSCRSHVASFADQVYSMQALSRYHRFFGDPEALAAADSRADRVCGLQGEAGQWWWHYDLRAGTVVEGYPVYSVHQDAMGPMALLDLCDGGGGDRAEVRRGLDWMRLSPEVGRSLVDESLYVIWRKVGRAAGKSQRTIRAGLSRVYPGLRAAWLDSVFRPSAIDFECRPYHLGWVLYTWLGRR